MPDMHKLMALLAIALFSLRVIDFLRKRHARRKVTRAVAHEDRQRASKEPE